MARTGKKRVADVSCDQLRRLAVGLRLLADGCDTVAEEVETTGTVRSTNFPSSMDALVLFTKFVDGIYGSSRSIQAIRMIEDLQRESKAADSRAASPLNDIDRGQHFGLLKVAESPAGDNDQSRETKTRRRKSNEKKN